MSKKDRRKRRREKVRPRTGEELRREGVEQWTQMAHYWKARALVIGTAFDHLYDDYNSARPRQSKQSYLDDAVDKLS